MIIVTSGHVDHGKTALLQALTGTHTAHLPEEKKRGMTIDLGYAYLPVGDKVLGFIDVPGHEKFLANMLAGLGGIDYAMLVVASDEGIQPQTQEHLTILTLLQIEQIIVVISKADRADDKQITQLKHQLQQRYPALAQSPIFVTSARTGQGIEQLRDYLQHLSYQGQIDKPFRYAIDRVFSLKGAGTVVTGTAFAGKVTINDELYLSTGQKVRIKNIHAQNQPSQQGLAGQRLALNINIDLAHNSIQRGDWLFCQPAPPPTERITIWLNSQVNLSENQAVHIYHAATRTTGRLTLLTSKQLAPQQQGLAELILDNPQFLAYGDKLILRSGDAKSVIAGAKVVEINSPKRYKRQEVRLNYLKFLIQARHCAERISLYLQSQARTFQQLCWLEQLTAQQLTQILQQNGDIHFQDWCFNQHFMQQQKANLLNALQHYHQQHPDQIGLGKARLYRIACLAQPEKLIYHFIEQMQQQGQIQQTRGWLHTPEHKLQFTTEERDFWQQVFALFEQQQGQALWVREVANTLSVEETLARNFMYKAGKLGYLTAVVKDRFFLTESIYAYARLIKQIIAEQGGISVNQLRDQLGFGRKLTVQLMEYYDRCGFLRRKGNQHLLRDQDIFDF
ncbi:selenocysteine-specific translation elongation factor [Volucribacter amazonae]|uniref:Selenocysteine-specific elongation factor n=1 Tax=Volucribacter amazonae TaxID=256731 RepID=A0A9X4SII7_9PAST|nr:selenocysteine-specific translation elongation factor [Volucribacter amazonae]MDG6895692.1 selenocysteine-specific translation elongation factor [Volucribacter amazonae]